VNENTPQEETTNQRITQSKNKINKDDIIQDDESTSHTSRRDGAEASAHDCAWDTFLAFVYLNNLYSKVCCALKRCTKVSG
jgi:hypothetical protein